MNILIVSPTPTHPITAGNRCRILATIDALQTAGHDVHFAHIERESGDTDAMRSAFGTRYHRIAYRRPPKTQGLGWRCLRWASKRINQPSWYIWGVDDWYDDRSDGQLALLTAQYDFGAVIVEYVFMSRALECFRNGALKVIDTHDVMTDRWRIFARSGQAPQWFSTTARQESNGLNRADVVLAIQDSERQFFQQISSAQVVTFGHLTSVDNVFLRRSTHQNTLVFVGSENRINVDGITHFIEHVYPRIRRRVPRVQLVLVGRVCESVPDSEGVSKVGRLQRISEAYALGDVAINPVQYGTGLNIKTIEALGYGMPLVCTAAGARGLERVAGKAYILATHDDEFVEGVVDLLSNAELARRFSTAACAFVREWSELQLAGLLGVVNRAVRHAVPDRPASPELL